MQAEDAVAPSILLVDDTVENLRLLTDMLAAQGFDLRPVTSGRDALNTVAHAAPDLILLDAMMPEMDGFEVCEKLRADPIWREIPVIFLTALGEVEHKLKGFAAGANDYITKPFQLEEVLSRVKNQLALQEARRDLQRGLQRLQELERLRDDLVHMIVHDMRTPLFTLFMNLELLKPKVQGEAVQILDESMQTAERLHLMANDLLDVSRLESGQMPLQRTRCDLSKLVARVCHEAHALEPERVLCCDADVPVPVSCDASLIGRVVTNLISNGIKHTATGTQLRVSVVRGEHGARVSVEDHGPGVAPEVRAHLFEKFAAVAPSSDRRYHSAGLGLAFCKLAIEAHAGRIGVDSAAGGGSVFWFELPTP